MNDDDIKQLSEDELAKHIDSLESQSWLQEIRSLQPHASGQDLYALGFAAGQHATILRPSSRWPLMTTAVLSSILSAAATALLMWQLSPSLARSSAAPEVALQPFHEVEPVSEPPTVAQTKTETMPQTRVEAATIDLDELLPGRLHASASQVVQGIGDTEFGSGQIESERTRYVTQRQRWLTELSATTPD